MSEQQLFLLPELAKRHYYWPMPRAKATDRAVRIPDELARITHTACVLGDGSPLDIELAVLTCARVNRQVRRMDAVIGLVYSPWRYQWPKNMFPDPSNPAYAKELTYFEQQFAWAKKMVEQYGGVYGANVRIGALILDTEVWDVFKDKYPDQVCKALDDIHQKALQYFPGVDIIWYGRGYAMHATKDIVSLQHWTGKEMTPILSVAMYHPHELDRDRIVYWRTAQLAAEMHLGRVVPFAAVGSAYKRDSKGQKFLPAWYSTRCSYDLGVELHRPEYVQATDVFIYPAPFREQTFMPHFAAYVRGACGMPYIAANED